MLLLAAKAATNEKNGNGKYKPLRKRKKAKKTVGSAKQFRYLANNDLTMQFSDERDPLYFAFTYMEQRTVGQLLGDFIEDSFFEISRFVSQVMRK